MRITQTFIFLFAVILSLTVKAEGKSTSAFTPETTVHKSVNAEGKVVFSKSGFSEKKIIKKNPVAAAPVKAIPAIALPKVDIYYAAWDPYSNKAIIFFRENRIVVNAYDIDLDPEAAARKKKIDPEYAGMPLVIVNGVVIRGVNEKKYKEALALTP